MARRGILFDMSETGEKVVVSIAVLAALAMLVWVLFGDKKAVGGGA